ncbi:VTT domain-containing protein [Actinoplanes sp. Pm04-4]|uniref:VTT domain-containing protein n=1 Tax=Paractinoplanes pyxinae TaxID=2997416 RepID=A0ABT4AQ65_9ACTN|nr:VTT domain-containing protein [Actinoplanes pyxinae]MCY1136388.1 VTT domain-containing protein [Actinoplanes pyxinae]
MLDRLTPLISSPWLYVVVFAIVAVDGFIPAMPSDPVVIGLAALSAGGPPDVAVLAAVVIAGGMAGDRVAYLLGRGAGHRVRNAKLVQAKYKAGQALRRYGGGAIIVGRFLPYGRTATAMTSGSAAQPVARFTLHTGLASVAWAAYAIGLGRLGGETFVDSPLLGAAFGMALGMVVGITHTLVQRRRRSFASAGTRITR